MKSRPTLPFCDSVTEGDDSSRRPAGTEKRPPASTAGMPRAAPYLDRFIHFGIPRHPPAGLREPPGPRSSGHGAALGAGQPRGSLCGRAAAPHPRPAGPEGARRAPQEGRGRAQRRRSAPEPPPPPPSESQRRRRRPGARHRRHSEPGSPAGPRSPPRSSRCRHTRRERPLRAPRLLLDPTGEF